MNGLASSIGGSDSLNKILKLQYLYVNYAHHKKDYWPYCHQFGKVICQPVKKELSVDPTISWTPKVCIWDAIDHGIVLKPISSKHLHWWKYITSCICCTRGGDLLLQVTSYSIHILVRLHGNHSTSLRAQWKSGLICVPYLRRAILHPIHHQKLLKLQKPASDGFRCVASSTRKLKMFRLPYGKYWMSLV